MFKHRTTLPSYCRHSGTRQAYVRLNGQFIYLGPHGSKASKLEYDRVVAEWLSSGRRPPERASEVLTITGLCIAYFLHAKKYYRKNGKPTTEVRTIQGVLRDIRKLYGTTSAIEFGPNALKAVRQTWIDRSLSRGTINQHCGRVVRMFRWATGEEMLPPTIAQALAMLPSLKRGRSEAVERKPVDSVSEEHIKACLKHVQPTIAEMIKLQLATGMRPGEVCMLRPIDIDQSSEVWEYTPQEHKTEHHGRPRKIMIGPAGQKILAPFLDRDAESYCFSPIDSEQARRIAQRQKRKTKVQPSQRCRRKKNAQLKPGEHYTTDSYRRAIHRACKAASIDMWSPNQLRHTMATRVRREFGLDAAQVILGHSTANITQVYAELDSQKARAIVRDIG